MKKLVVLAIAIMFTATIARAQDAWVNHKADDRVSFKFPSEPKEVAPGSFAAATKDSTVMCIFTAVDFVKVAGIDSVALAPIKATADFAGQLKAGMGQSLPDVNLADFTIGTYKGFTSYTSTGLDSKKKRYDLFMFIDGNFLYSLSTVTKDGASQDVHDKFLASLVVTQ